MRTKKAFGVGLLIFLSFLLTSGEYLTWWMDSLVPNFSSTAADFLSEGVGYLFQVIGLILIASLIKTNSCLLKQTYFFWLLILFDFLSSILACSFSLRGFILFFGFSMNFLHGCIAGWYLMLLSKEVNAKSISLTFGFSYAIASIAFYVLSQLASLFNEKTVIFVIYFIIAILTVFSNEYVNYLASKQDLSSEEIQETLTNNNEPTIVYERAPLSNILITMAFLLVVMVSFTRGLGFYFPSSDMLLNGIDPIFTRCFYAVGLILAGIINDCFRKYGGVLCMVSLIFPFIVLALINEPYSETLFWIIGYIFFGFLAVYRVTLLQDMSQTSEKFLWLSVMGLAMGRIGDVLGVTVGLLCNNYHLALVIISIILFTTCIVLFFKFHNLYYVPTKIIREKIVVDSSDSVQEAEQRLVKELSLSDREAEVLGLLFSKKTNGEIAYELHISENTVKFHVRNILKKAGCENRKQLLEKV